jgi:hypothetical protein
MHIAKRSNTITKLDDARPSTSRHEERKIRPSTGTVISPLVPVDGVELMRGYVSAVAVQRQNSSKEMTAQEQPTSIELLRQLEACVRELLDISAQSHR